MALETKVPLLRDLTCLLLGGAGFGHSVWSGAGWPPLLVSAALLAGPSVLQLWLTGRIPAGGSSPGSGPPGPSPPSPPLSPAPSPADP